MSGYELSTDKRRLDVDLIARWLAEESYWAVGRSLEVSERAIEGSVCVGAYAPDGEQAGFARVVTDGATFAWLCDVFVLPTHQGRGLGTWLIETVMEHGDLQGLRRFMLGTRDAHDFYARFGFERLSPEAAARFMQIWPGNPATTQDPNDT